MFPAAAGSAYATAGGVAEEPAKKPIPFWLWFGFAAGGVTLLGLIVITVVFSKSGNEDGAAGSKAGRGGRGDTGSMVNQAMRTALAAKTWATMQQLYIMLESHYAEYGQPPESIDDLAQRVGIPPSRLVDAWGTPFKFDAEARSIASAGIDREFGTDDDLVRSESTGGALPAYYAEQQMRLIQEMQSRGGLGGMPMGQLPPEFFEQMKQIQQQGPMMMPPMPDGYERPARPDMPGSPDSVEESPRVYIQEDENSADPNAE